MSFSVKQIKAILSNHNMPMDDLEGAAEEICSKHSADMDAIKEERDNFKKDAETLAPLKKENEDLKKQIEEVDDGAYQKLKKEFDDYKADVKAQAERAGKEEAFKEILKDAGIPEKHYAKIIKYSDIDGLELDDKGKVKDAKDMLKTIKEEWSDHIETGGQQGANTATPPKNTGGGKMTKEDIMKIKDTSERQKAIAENRELFGF